MCGSGLVYMPPHICDYTHTGTYHTLIHRQNSELRAVNLALLMEELSLRAKFLGRVARIAATQNAELRFASLSDGQLYSLRWVLVTLPQWIKDILISYGFYLYKILL